MQADSVAVQNDIHPSTRTDFISVVDEPISTVSGGLAPMLVIPSKDVYWRLKNHGAFFQNVYLDEGVLIFQVEDHLQRESGSMWIPLSYDVRCHLTGAIRSRANIVIVPSRARQGGDVQGHIVWMDYTDPFSLASRFSAAVEKSHGAIPA